MRARGASTFLLSLLVGLAYLFLYVPIFVLIVFSFNDNPLGYYWTGFTTRWYFELIASTEIWGALKNSILIACSSVAVSISMATAFVVSARNTALERLLLLFYGNLAVPEIVLAVGLLALFYSFSVVLGMTTLIAAHSLLGLGYAVPLIYTRFESLDRRFVEASLDLGATRWQTFRLIILPLLTPALISSSLLVFIISFDDFVLSFFCAGGSTQTLPMYIFSMLRAGSSPVVSALSVSLLVGSSILILLFSSLQARKAGMLP